MLSLLKKIFIFFIIINNCLLASDHWIESNKGISNLSISSIAIDKDDNIFISNNGTGVWFSQNHGIDWLQVNNGNSLNVISLAVNDSILLFAGTAGSGLYMTSNKGFTWAKIFEVEDTSHYIRSIVITDKHYKSVPNIIFITVDYEGIFYSSDNGFSWKRFGLENFNFEIINSLAITRNEYFFVGTQKQGLLRTTNFGTSWDSVSCPTSIIRNIMVNAQGVLFAGNANGKIYRSYDNGDSWDESASLYYSVNQIIDSKEGVIYVALNNNGPHLSPDYGQLWGPYTYGIGKRTVFTICESNRDTLYCGTESGVFKTVLEPKPLTYPILVTPLNNSKNMPLEISFYWYRSRVAEKHEIIISYNQDFSNICKHAFIDDNNFVIDNLSLNTDYFWKVRSIKQTDTSDWSEIRKFTTKLNPPKLLSPAHDTFNIDTSVVLTWETVDNAESYWVQIYEHGDLIYSNKQITSNSFSFRAKCNITYLWRVKSINKDSESDWSGYFKFLTKLPAPDLLNPTDKAIDMNVKIDFSWNYPNYFNTFDIEISTDSNFKNIFFTNPNLKKDNVTVDKFEYGKQYYWRVKVKYGISFSYWSDVNTFRTGLKAPSLITPENHSKGNTKDILFEWDMGILNDTTTINGYFIQISKYEDFKNILIEDSTLNDNSYQYDDFDYDTKYYWRVKANLNGNWTLFSDVWDFTIGLVKPHTIYPENQSKNIEIPVKFIWKKSLEFNNFTFQISDSSDMKKLLHEEKNITDTIFSYSLLDYNTQYYWRIRYSTDSNTSLWSDIRSFRTIKKSIAIPILLSPADNAVDLDTSLVLIWTDSTESNNYHLQVSGDATFQNCIVDNDTLTENQYFISGLKYNKKYYWRVRIMNNGEFGDFTKSFNFKTKSAIYVEKNEEALYFEIFPNPSSNTIYIHFISEIEGLVNIFLIDVLGNKILVKSEYKFPNNYILMFDLSDVPQGFYHLIFQNGKSTINKNLIIIK